MGSEGGGWSVSGRRVLPPPGLAEVARRVPWAQRPSQGMRATCPGLCSSPRCGRPEPAAPQYRCHRLARHARRCPGQCLATPLFHRTFWSPSSGRFARAAVSWGTVDT